ncbi:phage shock envelope stress response protein PspM [Saccharopolyspora sp. MS10]|uniref:phage shock envelope stress response protein PspM n=1 Tax=Saccharopolyspora sp. MS10 TaxID=3385973 RepID=UPI0039A01F90
MSRRKSELAEWGEAALRELRGPVAGEVRRKLARWRDPRARLLRKRKRARQTTTAGAVSTGVLGVGAVGSFQPQVFGLAIGAGPLETALDVAAFGLGGVALAAACGTVAEWRRYRRLIRMPLPEAPPEPVELPPTGSRAREPMRLLRDAEQSLHQALAPLEQSGFGEAADARATANRAATALREVAARLRAVESALPHVPTSEQQELRADADRLRAELDEGIEGYRHLVASAGRAAAVSGAQEQRAAVQDATDRLAGLATALHELGRGSDAAGPTGRG